jgi:hypothetical protein
MNRKNTATKTEATGKCCCADRIDDYGRSWLCLLQAGADAVTLDPADQPMRCPTCHVAKVGFLIFDNF